MVQTILNGGTKTTQDQYTGPENELSVDQSNRNLRLHDGSTPGGHVFLNQDNADARYQARSTELDGITGFEPQQRGILTRLGPADYRLRSLAVDNANMQISNANGYDGNPTFGLKSTVTSQHIWTGQQVFTELVEFTSEISANVVGSLEGDVTGNVTGDVVGDLTGDANGNHNGTFTGAVDVRGSLLSLDDNQIPTSKITDLISFIKLHGFPSGGVIMWSGSVANIPAGWFLCNGLNGTPDLRNRFIVGAGTGSDYAVGAVGGFPEQFPEITIYNSGSHTHALSGSTASNTTGVTLSTTIIRPEYEQNQVNVIGSVTLSDPGHSHNQGGQADSGGVHTHTADITSFDNRPPFYALCYIMKG
jgi:hypothetical protein